jgi:uncharacterized glyoxalase superfamily protein PhnB
MIHVPDVRATVGWYQSIGFTVVHTYEDEEGMTFALLSYGNSEIMLSAGGGPAEGDRRDVDLYVRTDAVEADYLRLKDRVEIRLGLENTFYGTREFIVRDPNGFWLTFGQTLGVRT